MRSDYEDHNGSGNEAGLLSEDFVMVVDWTSEWSTCTVAESTYQSISTHVSYVGQ